MSVRFDSLSVECMPRDVAGLKEWKSMLKQGERVLVPDIASRAFDEQLGAIRTLAGEGLRAVPHLGARNLRSAEELSERLRCLTGAGAKEILLLGGESNPPRGEFDCALQILRSTEFARSGIGAVGIAGHPEPHPVVADDIMFAALKAKAEAIAAMGLQGYIVTQLCFAADTIRSWLSRVRDAGIDLHVMVGVAGPVSLLRLMKLAGVLGVGSSLSFLRKRSKNMMQMLDPKYDPHAMLEEISRACESEAASITPHFYAFGYAAASIRVVRPDAPAAAGGNSSAATG